MSDTRSGSRFLEHIPIGKRDITEHDPLVEAKNHKRFSIQPSVTIKSGVYMAYNFHHDMSRPNDDNVTPGQRAANLIDREWERSWKDSVKLFDELLSIALKNRTGLPPHGGALPYPHAWPRDLCEVARRGGDRI